MQATAGMYMAGRERRQRRKSPRAHIKNRPKTMGYTKEKGNSKSSRQMLDIPRIYVLLGRIHCHAALLLLPQEALQLEERRADQLVRQRAEPRFVQRVDLQAQQLALLVAELRQPLLLVELEHWRLCRRRSRSVALERAGSATTTAAATTTTAAAAASASFGAEERGNVAVCARLLIAAGIVGRFALAAGSGVSGRHDANSGGSSSSSQCGAPAQETDAEIAVPAAPA